MTPDEAIARLRKKPNDSSAWEVIYKFMQAQLVAYVSSLLFTFSLNTTDPVHDIVHEVLCAFWKRWPSIKSQIPDSSAAYVYLKTASRNLLIDRYRHDRSAQPLLDFLTLKFLQDQDNPIVREILVREVIARLPAECGALLQSYVETGLSLAEMADRDGSSPSAFYSRWYRCLKRARDLLRTKP